MRFLRGKMAYIIISKGELGPNVLNYELFGGRSGCRRDEAVTRANDQTVIPPQAGCGPSPTERGRDPADGGGDRDGEDGLLRDKPDRET